MQTPLHLIEVNVKNKTGTDFYFASKNIIGDTPVEEETVKVHEINNSALILQYLEQENQPFALYGIYEQYWRKEGHVFQLADADLYIDDATTLSEIKNSQSYKELTQRPVATEWPFGYWGLTN